MMANYELFDSVRLREAVSLADGQRIETGTQGVVVELFQDGQAYLVELFGGWVKVDHDGDLVPANANDPQAFTETVGLATLTSQQIELLQPALKTVGAKTHRPLSNPPSSAALYDIMKAD
jgi:hypothetical protein